MVLVFTRGKVCVRDCPLIEVLCEKISWLFTNIRSQNRNYSFQISIMLTGQLIGTKAMESKHQNKPCLIVIVYSSKATTYLPNM